MKNDAEKCCHITPHSVEYRMPQCHFNLSKMVTLFHLMAVSIAILQKSVAILARMLFWVNGKKKDEER